MVELSNSVTIRRFPIIPGSANLIPGYDATGIPLKMLIRGAFLREKHGSRREIDENPGYFLGPREFFRRAGRPEQAARLPQAAR
jgi:hypothetical protein